MKGLEFAIIHYGYVWNDLAWNVSLPYMMTRHHREPYGEFCRFPGHCVLIKHPAEGYILYDVGDTPEIERPDFWDEDFPLECARDNCVDRQLERAGISVNDISKIIVSHLHYDHADGLKYFENTEAGKNVYVSRADFLQACETALTCPDEKKSEAAYWRRTFIRDGLSFNLIEEDEIELFEGVHLYRLQGHTAGVLAMMLELESGNYLFPNDACGSALNYGPPAKAPAIISDSLSFHKQCMPKLYELQKKNDATIIFSHDRAQIETLKKFPEFYR